MGAAEDEETQRDDDMATDRQHQTDRERAVNLFWSMDGERDETYLVTRMKIFPRSRPNFSLATSDAEVEQAGYSPEKIRRPSQLYLIYSLDPKHLPPTPTPTIPRATVLSPKINPRKRVTSEASQHPKVRIRT